MFPHIFSKFSTTLSKTALKFCIINNIQNDWHLYGYMVQYEAMIHALMAKIGRVPIDYYVEVSLWLIPLTRICASAAAFVKKPAPWALFPLTLKASAKSTLTSALTAVPAQAPAP